MTWHIKHVTKKNLFYHKSQIHLNLYLYIKWLLKYENQVWKPRIITAAIGFHIILVSTCYLTRSFVVCTVSRKKLKINFSASYQLTCRELHTLIRQYYNYFAIKTLTRIFHCLSWIYKYTKWLHTPFCISPVSTTWKRETLIVP